MTSEIDTLRILATLDDEIFEKEEKTVALPQALADEVTVLDNLRSEAEHLGEDIQLMQKDAHLTEVDIEGVEKEIEDYTIKLNIVKKNEEYRLITEKIKELEGKKSQFEDRAIEFLTEADEFKNKLVAQGGLVKAQENEIEKKEKEVTREVEDLKKEIEELKIKRDGQARDIGLETIDKYERVRNRLKSGAVCEVLESCCLGCRLTVPPNDVNKIMAGKVITCRHCSRILFLGNCE